MTLRYATLGLLAQHQGSGYDLLQRFQESLVHVWPATQSQLYGELNRMADQGLIEVVATGARGRKTYAITDAGRDELVAWLTRPDPAEQRSPTLLRVFLMDTLPPEAVRSYFINERASSVEALADLEQLRDARDWESDGLSRYGRITLEFGLRHHQLRIDWCDWALDYLKLR